MSDAPISSKKVEKKKGYDEWELDDAVRTLIRAEEIKDDEPLMKAIKPHLDKKVKAVKSIADLKRIASEKDKENKDD